MTFRETYCLRLTRSSYSQWSPEDLNEGKIFSGAQPRYLIVKIAQDRKCTRSKAKRPLLLEAELR